MNRAGRVSLLLGIALLAACTAAADEQNFATTLAIVGATVIHPERELPAALEPDTTIVVAGNRIRAVGPSNSTPVPETAEVIDGRGKWVVPGLTDSHVHLAISANLYARPDIADFRGVVPFEQEVARHLARLPATFKVWLASGVTSVIDVGGPMKNFEIRGQARRSPEAPRVLVAGPLISTVARPELDVGDPPIIEVTTPEQVRAVVALELAHRPDFIKVWFIRQRGDDLAAIEPLVRAAGDAAHSAGVRFAVHATELETAKAALRAGADFLVHSVEDRPVDAEFLALARARGAIYCPTLFVMDGYGLALSNTWRATEAELRLADPQVLASMADLGKLPASKVPPWIVRMMHEGPRWGTQPQARANLRRVWDAGITVAMGTDAGNIGTLHGPSVFRELRMMVQAGLTPLEALRSATTNGAKAMGLEREVGTVAPGMVADLVIVDSDPLADIGNLSRVHRVVRNGRVFDPERLIESIR